jgi:hypothetical protein
MQIIPLSAVPNQAVLANLAGQTAQISIYQKRTGLFADIYLNNVLLIAGRICMNKNLLVRDVYFGFVGDLGFVDQNGQSDPDYTRLGTRFFLYYIEASDISAA